MSQPGFCQYDNENGFCVAQMKAVRPEDRPSVIERMKAGKKELDARNAAKALESHKLNTEQTK